MATTVLYPFVSAYSQTDKVLELANTKNAITGVKLSSINARLGIPIAVDPAVNDNRNTQVTVQAILGKDYHGSRAVRYDRLAIEKFLSGVTPEMPISGVGVAVTVDGVVSWLRNMYGLDVVAADVTVSAVDTSVLPAAGTVTINAGSLMWTGSFNFNAVLDALDLINLVRVNVLEGFAYPNSDLTKGQAQIYSWSLRGTDFTHELEIKVAGESAATNVFAELLTTISDDNWVLSDTSSIFNLKGATVVYNGVVANAGVTINPKFAKVTVLQLGPLCSNLGGLITIWYGAA